MRKQIDWVDCKYCEGSEGHFDSTGEVWIDCQYCEGAGGHSIFSCGLCSGSGIDPDGGTDMAPEPDCPNCQGTGVEDA